MPTFPSWVGSFISYCAPLVVVPAPVDMTKHSVFLVEYRYPTAINFSSVWLLRPFITMWTMPGILSMAFSIKTIGFNRWPVFIWKTLSTPSLLRAKHAYTKLNQESPLTPHWGCTGSLLSLCCRAKHKVLAAVAPSSPWNTLSGFILAPFCISMAVITSAIGQNVDFNSVPKYKKSVLVSYYQNTNIKHTHTHT